MPRPSGATIGMTLPRRDHRQQRATAILIDAGAGGGSDRKTQGGVEVLAEVDGRAQASAPSL